jgi:hypothetical protein
MLRGLLFLHHYWSSWHGSKSPDINLHGSQNITERVRVMVMVFNATFNKNFCYIVAVLFIGGGNRSTRNKTMDLSQVTDKLYHTMLYLVHIAWAGLLKEAEIKHSIKFNICSSNNNIIWNTVNFLYLIKYETKIMATVLLLCFNQIYNI